MPIPVSKYPAFVRFNYTSQYGNHTQEMRTLAWAGTGLGDPGNFLTHTGGTIAADTMATAYVNLVKALYPITTIFTSYTIFNVPTPAAEPQPVYTGSLGIAGTDVTTEGWDKAVQLTFSIRTTAFKIFRCVLLDKPTENNFGNSLVLDTPSTALVAHLTSPTNAWADSEGGRPAAFLDISITLNKRLRRKYGMI